MVILLVCQQLVAGSMVFASALPFDGSSGNQPEMLCHEANSSGHSNMEMASASSSHQMTMDMSGQSCADMECQCCIGSCSTALISQYAKHTITSSRYIKSHYDLKAPTAPTTSLFRPPISA
jgi:hypothetical protein